MLAAPLQCENMELDRVIHARSSHRSARLAVYIITEVLSHTFYTESY